MSPLVKDTPACCECCLSFNVFSLLLSLFQTCACACKDFFSTGCLQLLCLVFWFLQQLLAKQGWVGQACRGEITKEWEMQGEVLQTPKGTCFLPLQSCHLLWKIHPTANNLSEGKGDLQLIPSRGTISRWRRGQMQWGCLLAERRGLFAWSRELLVVFFPFPPWLEIH